ncbi:hypothetical protein [Gordonia malaquae]|uniref:hypothetical protein n=1 Tax=Gordonia malaquae TaxID=410332 RepID=UPI003017CD88
MANESLQSVNTTARELREGDIVDLAALADTYGRDLDESTKISIAEEKALIMEVQIEPSSEPGAREVAVLYTDQVNLAVDADAPVTAHRPTG